MIFVGLKGFSILRSVFVVFKGFKNFKNIVLV